MSSLC